MEVETVSVREVEGDEDEDERESSSSTLHSTLARVSSSESGLSDKSSRSSVAMLNRKTPSIDRQTDRQSSRKEREEETKLHTHRSK